MKKILLVWLIFSSLLQAGCSGLPDNLFAPTVTLDAPSDTPPAPTSTSIPIPAASPTPPGPLVLTVWVPPEFDPAAGTPAGDLLNARLAEFAARRPDVQVQVRVKAVDGAGGLYESLAAADAAAQRAMPDLVALPYPVFQAAGQKGLLRPLNGVTNALDEPDWYEYAREMAHLQNNVLGLPFAGDALVQVYRPEQVALPLSDWQIDPELQNVFSFAAADPRGLVPLALYLANGGQILDDQGQITLEAQPLEELLAYIAAAEQAEVMPAGLAELQVQEQADAAFSTGQADMLATWVSHYLRQKPADASLLSLPTPDGKPFTLATGWVWALPAVELDRRELAAELAEFLTESDYLARWSEAAGYLPARPSALAAWSSLQERQVLDTLSKAGRLLPASEILGSLGPLLQNATVQILKQAADPPGAAQEAIQNLQQK
jgi:ABC-type glycerol-3-phosphate transport system substrate-binding protein